MNKEFEFLKIITSSLNDSKYLGDDCAYLDEYNLAISKDCLVEDVHFSLEYMNPKEIARKALLVNISDILASGALPKYALIGLSGKLKNSFVDEFYQGIKEISDEYNIKIIGGDLTKSDKIYVSVTILGDYKNKNVSSRKNAKEGYIVATVGEFGSSAQGLYNLQNKIEENYFVNYHKNPPLFPQISDMISKTTKYPYAMMDSSDGLVDCLVQISNQSNVKIEIDYNLISHKTQNENYVLYGGEDYALVVVLHEDDYKRIKGLNKIGVCSRGNGVYLNNKKLSHKAFEHFS